jgi:hypothetical protein
MGTNHFTLKDGGTIFGLCQTKNPLGNLRKMSLQEVTERSELRVAFTQSGTLAHALHHDSKTVLGPWVKFTSEETLEKALRYLGATDEQIAAHGNQMRRYHPPPSTRRRLGTKMTIGQGFMELLCRL